MLALADSPPGAPTDTPTASYYLTSYDLSPTLLFHHPYYRASFFCEAHPKFAFVFVASSRYFCGLPCTRFKLFVSV